MRVQILAAVLAVSAGSPASGSEPAGASWIAPPPAPPSPGAPDRKGRRGRLSLGLDLFLPMNAGDGLAGDLKTGAGILTAGGYSGSWQLKTSGAVGVRILYLRPAAERIDVGGSFGFIRGPNSDGSLAVSGGGRTGTVAIERSVEFLRFMLEGAAQLDPVGPVVPRFGAGLGAARGRLREALRCTGTACVQTGSRTENSASWTGFTWELSAGLSYRRLLATLRMAAFPDHPETSGTSRFDWTTLGFTVGFGF